MRVRRPGGQALVEFALMFPVLFFVLIATIDVFRIVAVRNSVAEAARQGARQAVANAQPGDSPFAAADGNPCSGQVFTTIASGHGCLTDARVVQTVNGLLGAFNRGTTLYSNTPASSCPSPATPGTASVCITPSETGAAGGYSDCPGARTALGRDPVAGELGSRSAEWSQPRYRGCFFVQVTVIYRYDSITPLAGLWAPGLLKLASTTTMLAEY